MILLNSKKDKTKVYTEFLPITMATYWQSDLNRKENHLNSNKALLNHYRVNYRPKTKNPRHAQVSRFSSDPYGTEVELSLF